MKKLHFLFLALSFLGVIGLQAQIELPEDKVSWNFTLEQKGCEATIIGRVKIVDHWHINATKLPAGSFGYATKIEFKKSPAYKLIGGIIEPKPILKHDDLADEDLAYHEGTVVFKQKIEILSDKDFDLNGSFSFQTCNEVKCLPDHTAAFKVKVKGCSASDNADAQKKLISDFTKIDNDVATHKNGSTYVLVYGQWNEVPQGNSVEFYKKYLTITRKDEK